ncbi:endoplasmic reticulum-based factor for assembly of V-ATPase-domain-containing protein [Microdochium trichocladiopsis]|uniref:Endoplasmic reticulum-based factor for assembly of V-ATPase-domain-containing protein n=1 Tax=Microdochium trichocladiopsis TaxID=1682393 RepID=A0A9P8Y3K5_9PEZI|nr:endoplasmic reticulum-based factor for assembly of V-ATPase-domain-containing protein [Microdochium trichocladiopsis]KAH7029088.1 endoplasmic reticulum-based factor for assembly of V-ATPase-domain-containing protein [Microdochium trichocladiopsis]
MVLLTMTRSIVEALQAVPDTQDAMIGDATAETSQEPSLSSPAIGKPISHGQIIDLRNRLKPLDKDRFSLEKLLLGASVYVPPPPPKAEPSEEYKALMARLRRDEEERAYERLTQKSFATREAFSERFPGAPMSMAHAFAETNRPSKADDIDGDEFEFGDVQRQVTLIFNFLVSIIGCGAALWLAARWWSTPARLFLALGGSIVVAIAEVIVYSIFNWRIKEGGKREKKKKEHKEILNTWVVGGPDDGPAVPEEKLLDGPGEHSTGVDHAGFVRKRIKDADVS